jgi:chitobiase/beta-hexosaminidase-like protein
MRPLVNLFSFLLLSSFAAAQDPATQAAQAAQQATQQAMEANRQASEAAQRSMQDTLNAQATAAQPWLLCALPPKFSVKSGTYSSPVTVKITDKTRGAVIHYTTDGWTPTPDSPRYRGPILMESTTTLQAIAFSSYGGRSLITSGQYLIAGTAPRPTEPLAPPNSAVVHLEFAAQVSSRTAEVGDKIPMILTEDLQVGNTVVKKGALATGTITAVDRTGAAGAPGVLSFEVDSLQSNTGTIPLFGGATREGTAKPPNAAFLIPVVGPFTLLKHGTDAVIDKGTTFIAFVSTETASNNVR